MSSAEQILLKAFIDRRDDFDKYGPYILGLKNMDRNTRLMLGFIKSFYDKYKDANSIPEPELRLYCDANDTFNFIGTNNEYVKSIYELSLTNQELKMDIIEAAVERHFMADVVDKASLVLENNKAGVLSTIQDIIDEYHSVIRKPPAKDIVEYQLDLKQLIKEEVTTNGIPFINPTPNDTIRGMRKGQLGLIYAYTDTGKTSYGISNLVSVGRHLHQRASNRPAIYAVNEEAIERVTLRAIQCITNWNNNDIEKNEALVAGILKVNGFDKLKFFDHVNNMRVVEKLLTQYNPRVMFIDQGTKVTMPGSKKEGVNALEEIFGTYRDLAKRHACTIVCMAQGGDGCFEKKNPDLRDLYGSKSAIQGELDWAISIGVDATDVKYAGWRFFNISKNKGDKATYACRFDHQKCQFKEVV